MFEDVEQPRTGDAGQQHEYQQVGDDVLGPHVDATFARRANPARGMEPPLFAPQAFAGGEHRQRDEQAESSKRQRHVDAGEGFDDIAQIRI
jgi:hypothetical protein